MIDLRTSAEGPFLFEHAHPPIDGGPAQAGVPRQTSQKALRLDGELAGRREDERIGMSFRTVQEALEHREKEGGRLAGAGLGRPDHVPSEDGVGDRALLDGGRGPVAHLPDPLTEGGVERQVLKGRVQLGGTLVGSYFGVAHVALRRPDADWPMGFQLRSLTACPLKKARHRFGVAQTLEYLPESRGRSLGSFPSSEGAESGPRSSRSRASREG